MCLDVLWRIETGVVLKVLCSNMWQRMQGWHHLRCVYHHYTVYPYQCHPFVRLSMERDAYLALTLLSPDPQVFPPNAAAVRLRLYAVGFGSRQTIRHVTRVPRITQGGGHTKPGYLVTRRHHHKEMIGGWDVETPPIQ
jgi:hypothetical protein